MAATQAIAHQKSVFEKSPRLYSLEEYLRREAKAVDKHEFYNGIIQKMGNAKFNHNLITSNTSRLLGNALLEMPFIVLGDGQKIFIESKNVAVYPDCLVICEKPVFYNGLEYLITNPLVVVEVLSRSTAQYDRTDKFSLYKTLPSFKEYVLIDSLGCEVETCFREEPDLWRFKTETDLAASVTFRALGVSIALSDIYRKVAFSVKGEQRV